MQTDADLWEHNLGRLNWVRGTLLLYARLKCKRGQWGKFLASTGLSQSQSQLLRKIAQTITESNSHKLTYTEMLAVCYPSFRQALNSADPETKTKRKPKKNKSLTIDKLTDSIRKVGVDARKIVDARWLDSHHPPSDTKRIYSSCLGQITSAERDLERIKKEIKTRITKLSSKTTRKMKVAA